MDVVIIMKIKPRKLDIKNGCIDLSHGSGGQAMTQLIQQLFLNKLDNPILRQQQDSAVVDYSHQQLVVATDSHVVSPLFFPGGNIGDLAVNGTINDLAMSGATPLYLTLGLILEEGFPLSDLSKIIETIANAARKAKVQIITGDTKVVEKNKGDGVFINTTGIGYKSTKANLHSHTIRVGDKILLSGSIGEHGIAVYSQREHLQFDTPVISDTAPLHELVEAMLNSNTNLRCLRDPTRGGVAAVLNEFAHQANVGFLINEESIPVQEAVKGACEILGFDPLHIANEGRLIAVCAPNDAEQLLNVMQGFSIAKDATIIGEVIEDEHNFVQMKTTFGGQRIVDWVYGEQLPRIC